MRGLRLMWLTASAALLAAAPAAAQEPLPPLPLDEPAADAAPADACAIAIPYEPVPGLAADLDGLLEAKALVGARVGVLAVAYPEGTVLYARNANDRFNPASVAKLFTGVAALAELGPDRTFETAVFRGDEECGPLVLKGGGDPGLVAADVRKLAAQVAAAGVTCAQRVAYDVRMFDEKTLPPHFGDKESDASWRARVGALAMEEGGFSVTVRPGLLAGAPPLVEIAPACDRCFVVENAATTVETVEKGKLADVTVERRNGKTLVRIFGQVPLNRKSPLVYQKAIPDPDAYTAAVFMEALLQAGVVVKDDTVQPGKKGRKWTKVASVRSDPLQTDLARMETHSRNFIAEQVVKLLGFAAGCRPATFSCGLAVIRQTMRRFGVDPECTRLENGSGLFSADEVSPAQVVRFLLSTLNRKDIAGPFLKTLAIGGKTGTLKDRLKNVKRPVLAKTGTLDDVSALAGIIDRGEGRTIVFAILMNGCSDNSTEEIRNVQDRMVGRLAKWGQPDKKRH